MFKNNFKGKEVIYNEQQKPKFETLRSCGRRLIPQTQKRFDMPYFVCVCRLRAERTGRSYRKRQHIYRWAEPDVRCFEQRIAALEGGAAALATTGAAA